MCVYNGEKYLREAIDSVLNQTLRDLELIIVDDASTDATRWILAEYERRDPRVRIIANPTNMGCTCRNLAFEAARAKYIAIHDADDISRPDRLERQAEEVETFYQKILENDSH